MDIKKFPERFKLVIKCMYKNDISLKTIMQIYQLKEIRYKVCLTVKNEYSKITLTTILK